MFGCVSLKLSPGAAVKAKDVSYKAPPKPFEELKDAAVDKAWISQKTRNIISYLSECGKSSERSLQVLQSEALNGVNQVSILEEKLISYNGRSAAWTTAAGQLDGIAVKMSLLTLKKNNCDYTLSYSGLERSFERCESI